MRSASGRAIAFDEIANTSRLANAAVSLFTGFDELYRTSCEPAVLVAALVLLLLAVLP